MDLYLDATRNARDSAQKTDDSPREAEPELHGSPLQRGDLVEVQGPSGSGKTSLCIFLIMITVLPDTYEAGHTRGEIGGKIKVEIGGKGQRAALLVHAGGDSVRSLERLETGIKSHLDKCFSAAGMRSGQAQERRETIESITRIALSRLVVFKIQPAADRLDLASTTSPWSGLCTGLQYLMFHANKRAEGEISLFVVEGFGDPYWQARWYKDQRTLTSRTARPAGQGGITSSSDIGMDDVMDRLTRLRKDLGCVVLVTNQSLWKPNHPQSGKPDAGSSFWAQHLPPPYPSPFQSRSDQDQDGTNPVLRTGSNRYWPMNVHITMSGPSTTLRQFRPDITLAETWKQGGEGYKREMARREACWKGLVRCTGGARSSTVAKREHGEFEMWVGEDGVVGFDGP